MNIIKETYKYGASHDVIEEYKQYIKRGLIRVCHPLDYDSNSVWEIVELTEEELLARIAEAKEKEKELSQLMKNLTLIEF